MIRVLVIDDDDVDLRALRRAVEERGLPFALTEARSAEEGRRLLGEQGHDVALVDVFLGDGDGVELIRAAGGMPVVIVTGSGDESVAARALREGATDYLVKTVHGGHLRLLEATVERAIERKRLEREAGERAQALDRVVEELEWVVSVVVQDIGAPLRGVVQMADELAELLGEAEEPRRRAESIVTSCRELGRLTEELRTYLRVDAEEDRYDVPLAVLVDEVIAELGQGREAAVRIERVSELPVVGVVPARIRQLFHGLAAHAVRHAAAEHPVLHVRAGEGPTAVTVSVLCEGWELPGDGGGPGWAVCRRIVEQHGGRIWIDRSPGQVHFTLPARTGG